MAGPKVGKVLRIGIFQGDRCIEERLIRKRVPVTIGQTLQNTFVVPASSMPKSITLFDIDDKGNYVLRLSDRMGGRLSLGNNEVVDLTRLKNVDSARRTSSGYELPLNDSARGKVTVGDTRILFQFVTPPSSTVGILPTALGGGALAGFSTFLSLPILITLAVSAVFQMAPLVWIMLKDWPEPEDYREIPDWYLEAEVEVYEEEEEEEPKEKEEEEPDEIEGLEPVEFEEEPSLVPDESEEEESSAPDDEPKSAEKAFEDRQAGKKLGIQLLGAEGGESLGEDIASGITQNMTDIGLGNVNPEDFGRQGGESAGLGLGSASGTAGEPGLKGKDGTGKGNKAIGTGPSSSGEPKKRKRIDFKIKENTKIPKSVKKADKASMESVFRKKQSEVKRCYRRVIQKYGSQPGKLVVKIAIGSDGKVLKVSVTADEVEHGLARCVKSKIKRWRFPATGGTVSVYKRWVFS